jgi:hypothetical protein
MIFLKWGYITVPLVWKSSHAREIPFSIFQEKRGQQLVVASLGSEVSIFGMLPLIPNYKNNFGSNNIYEQ